MAATVATALLAKHKDLMLRVVRLDLSTAEPDVTEAVMRRELCDCIEVRRTPPGGGARIVETLYIQKIEISGSNDQTPWTVTWGVSPV